MDKLEQNEVREVPLTRGQVALVAVDDYERVAAFKWNAYKGKKDHKFYAGRTGRDDSGRRIHIAMHAFIIGAKRGEQVDHIDGNTLNNVGSNLRICTNAQNRKNRAKNKNNSSGFKGVHPEHDPRYINKKWRAVIGVNGKKKHLGRFATAEEAAQAYDEAAKKYHGEFARLNFPQRG